MSNGHSDGRRSVGLLWLVAAVGTGLAIWAACTNLGGPSYRTCSAAPAAAGPATPAMLVADSATATRAVAPSVPWRASGPRRASAAGELACSG
jgi:hypothetical protein